jgi:hypothetical protein
LNYSHENSRNLPAIVRNESSDVTFSEASLLKECRNGHGVKIKLTECNSLTCILAIDLKFWIN